MQRTTKALVRLRGCADRSAPLLFACAINRFSHDVAQIVIAAHKFQQPSKLRLKFLQPVNKSSNKLILPRIINVFEGTKSYIAATLEIQ